MIFLDNASTTPCYRVLAEEHQKYSTEEFFNPSALYGKAVQIHKKIEEARQNLLGLLDADNYNITFCGSATEANNLAINTGITKSKQIAISLGEHPSVFEPAIYQRQKSIEVLELPLNSEGVVDENKFKELDFANISLISIIHVSNETGAINPIKELVKIAKQKNPKILFHSDGVQAFGKINVSLEDLGVDMYTISAHKLHGPKGIGALVSKKNINLKPTVFGGGQENRARSGTENVAGIIAFSRAASIKCSSLETDKKAISLLNQKLVDELKKNNLPFIQNSPENASPYILSLSIEGLRGEVLLHALESYDIYIGTGSACSVKKIKNRVLSAMGRTQAQIEGNIRISFSVRELDIDIAKVAKLVAQTAQKLIK